MRNVTVKIKNYVGEEKKLESVEFFNSIESCKLDKNRMTLYLGIGGNEKTLTRSFYIGSFNETKDFTQDEFAFLESCLSSAIVKGDISHLEIVVFRDAPNGDFYKYGTITSFDIVGGVYADDGGDDLVFLDLKSYIVTGEKND